MSDTVFADPTTLLFGGTTGFIFGFLLQKGGVTRFSVILGQFLLKDFTVLKIMLSAIVVGSIGLYGMREMGLDVGLHIKQTHVLGNVLGGLIFGVGMATLGYCPGTGVAAIGEGSRHAIFGVLGMIAGAWVFAQAYPWLNSTILNIGSMGKATLPSYFGGSNWKFIIVLAVGSGLIFWSLERWGKNKKRDSH